MSTKYTNKCIDFNFQIILKTPYSSQSSASNSSPSTSQQNLSQKSYRIEEQELDKLMELDVIKAVLKMGFSCHIVRCTLKKKLEQTGQPFFSLDPCIEAVIQYMEDEAREALKEASNSSDSQPSEPLTGNDVVQESNESSIPSVDVVNTSRETSTSEQENTELNSSVTSETSETEMEVASGDSNSDASSTSSSDVDDVLVSNESAIVEHMEVLQRADEVINEAEKVLNMKVLDAKNINEKSEVVQDPSKDLDKGLYFCSFIIFVS